MTRVWRRFLRLPGSIKPAQPIDVYGGGVEALVKGAIAYLTPNAEIRWWKASAGP